MINVEGLLLTCFVMIFSLKESEVWRKAISKQNYCHASVPHKVCRLLTSPVLLRKFTLKIRGRRRQVKRRFKSEFAVFQSSSRLFRRCLFKVHDVTRDATTIFSATQGSNAGTTLQPFETTSQQCFIAVRVALKIVVANRPMQHHLYVLYKT